MSDPTLAKLEDIAKDVGSKSKDALTDALKEAINLGRNSVTEWIKMGTTVVPPEIASDMASLYLTAETATLAGKTIYAASIVDRLNVASEAYGTIYKSQAAKKLMAMWKSVLSIITKLISSLGSVASGGLTGLVKVGVDAVASTVDKAATDATKKLP